jgi:hypothetical protein
MQLKWNQLEAFCCQGVRRSLFRCVFLRILWEKNQNTLSRSGKCWMLAKFNWWKWHYCQRKFSNHEGSFMFYCFFITVFDLFYLVNINVNFYWLKRVIFMAVTYNFIHLRWLKLICLKESDLDIKKYLLMRDCNMQTKSDGWLIKR